MEQSYQGDELTTTIAKSITSRIRLTLKESGRELLNKELKLSLQELDLIAKGDVNILLEITKSSEVTVSIKDTLKE